MWAFLSAMLCTMLYAFVVHETTVFEQQDPVFLVRSTWNPFVVAALYSFCVMHMCWDVLGLFRMKTCFVTLAIVIVSMVVVVRYLVHLYTDTLITNINGVLGCYLDMFGLGSAIKLVIPPLNTWIILKQSWSYSAFFYDWTYRVITLPRFLGAMPNNCCFVFSSVHYTAIVLQRCKSPPAE